MKAAIALLALVVTEVAGVWHLTRDGRAVADYSTEGDCRTAAVSAEGTATCTKENLYTVVGVCDTPQPEWPVVDGFTVQADAREPELCPSGRRYRLFEPRWASAPWPRCWEVQQVEVADCTEHPLPNAGYRDEDYPVGDTPFECPGCNPR